MAQRIKYDPEVCYLVEHWTREGLINEEIAKRLGIAVCTLYEWQKKYPEFSEALKVGKQIIDYRVEDSLLKRALGYDVTETKTVVYPDGRIKTETTIKHIAPDTTAQIFWLKNRKPELWRDKQVIETTNPEEEHQKAEEYKKAIEATGQKVFEDEEN